MRILITGGAGYIGSHVLRTLAEAGHSVLTYDNLSAGHLWAVLYGEILEADLSDYDSLSQALAEFKPDAVVHLAASVNTEESVKDPLAYYKNNTQNTINLLSAMIANNVNLLLFSSTAAVCGVQGNAIVTENDAVNPANPYASSKAMAETIIKDTATANPNFRYVTLRYFNVAGADTERRIGESYRTPFHLITMALKTAKGEYDSMNVFGSDYDTPDGTCIRDYVHVDDVSQVHSLALDYLARGGKSDTFNVGYGRGSSVLDIIAGVKRITGMDFRVEQAPRRPGDVSRLVADPAKLKRSFLWSPKHDSLDEIIRSAWQWEIR